MKVHLGDIATIQFGFYTKSKDSGNARYLQGGQFDDYGNQVGEIDTFIAIDRKNEGHLLKEGDILLAGKGQRNFAWTYHADFGSAIASSIFFVIKPDHSRVKSEFLTTLFNMPQTQSYFQTLGAGSNIPSIRKSELAALPIALPPLDVQEKAVALKDLHYQDLALSHQIIEEKKKVYQAIINKLIFDNHG